MLLVVSIFVFSGGGFTLFKWYRSYLMEKLSDPQYAIRHIVQTGPIKEALNTQYLAEILHLSSDQPIHLFEFDEKEGEALLLTVPIIKTCTIKKLKPATLYIDYSLRIPIAEIGDYDNLAIDSDQCLFPSRPFFTPQAIAQIYLGIHEACDFALKPALELAMQVLESIQKRLKQTRLKIIRVDVSRAFLSSLGQREIVATLEDEWFIQSKRFTFRYLLRLSRDYEQNIRQFMALRKELQKQQKEQCQALAQSEENRFFFSKVIDLRIENLAYIQEEPE